MSVNILSDDTTHDAVISLWFDELTMIDHLWNMPILVSFLHLTPLGSLPDSKEMQQCLDDLAIQLSSFSVILAHPSRSGEIMN